MKLLFLNLFILCFSQQKYNIIPTPAKLTESDGTFSFTSETKIIIPSLDDTFKNAAEVLVERIRISGGLTISVEQGSKGSGSSYILCTINESILNREGYILKIKPNEILISAKEAIGIFYAFQSIRQLLPPEIESESPVPGIQLQVPSCIIEDEPRFVYRGFMLDVCRHFSPYESVKRYIDLLALHKFNNFHFHLTEDQGWRIEIKKYPKLTEIGAWRGKAFERTHKNAIGSDLDHTFENFPLHSVNTNVEELATKTEKRYKKRVLGDGLKHNHHKGLKSIIPLESIPNVPYGGFYTQEQIKEIVKHSVKRFVNIVPEIEMPGHALAALASYPEYSCTGGPFQVATSWGVFSDVFCAKNETFNFLQDVLTEVIDLFPSKMIHIGGDECPKGRWSSCEKCKETMRENSISNAHNLQSYFIKRIETFVNSKSRRIIGWDEIMEGGLAPNAAVMSWRGTSGGIQAARSDHDAVMTPMSHCYFDFSQEKGATDLARVYTFDPLPTNAGEKEKLHILGGQANLWRERVPDEQRVEYMMFPRASSLAEALWSPKSRMNFDNFMNRLAVQTQRYDILKINYCKSNLPKSI